MVMLDFDQNIVNNYLSIGVFAAIDVVNDGFQGTL